MILDLANDVARQDRGGVELEERGPEQTLLVQRGVLAVERQQVVQVDRRLGPRRSEPSARRVGRSAFCQAGLGVTW